MKILKKILFAFVLIFHSTPINSTIFKHLVLKNPNAQKLIYLYFDIHLPLQLNDKQIELVDQVINKCTGTTILAECTRLDVQTFKNVNTKIKPLFNFPAKIVSHIKQQIDSYTGAPNINDQFLTKLADRGKKAVNFMYADDNRLSINNGISYLWLMGWLAPLARLVGLDTSGYEKDFTNRNPDNLLLQDLIENTKKNLITYLNELKDISSVDKSKRLTEKIKEVEGIIKQYNAIATDVLKFAGPRVTLGQFRNKANKHAENLTKKFGATKEVVNAQLREVLGTDFAQFFSPAIQCYTFKPYNALDSTLLNHIFQDKSSKPVVVYVGAAHARFLEQSLIKQGYFVLEESQARANKSGKITLYKEFDDFLASFRKKFTFTINEIAEIGKEFLGPLEETFLAPLKNTTKELQ